MGVRIGCVVECGGVLMGVWMSVWMRVWTGVGGRVNGARHGVPGRAFAPLEGRERVEPLFVLLRVSHLRRDVCRQVWRV